MTETVDEAFWATTADGSKLLYLSPAFEKILGLSKAGARSSLLDAVYAEDRPLLADALRRIAQDDTDTETLHRVQRADGILRWVRTKGFPVKDAQGRTYRLVGFLEDITERKLADEALRESESKLRDLFHHSPDVIMTVDERGKILLMNRSIPALPAERALGRSSLALMPAEFRKWFRKALRKVFRKGATKQFQYSMNDGTYWEGRIVPIRGDDDGSVSAAMVIAADVTEKRNLEAQALRNARLASIGVLAAGVAHEINNPNNAILFNASLVSRVWRDITPILQQYAEEQGDFALGGLSFSEAGDSLPRLFAEITRNSERIRRIVQNLKHMARQDAGDLTEQVDMQQVLEATAMILHNQIQKYTDVWNFEVPDDLPPVQGNSQQLEQVFINVLLNALQALPERTRGVYVRAGLDADRGLLEVTIRDEGKGISERDLGRLTEPFFTTRTDAGGTGLGLSISRAIVERHGGSMGFESQLGRGTTVTIRVPVIPRA
jgi:PAS domain S-box-containing protein